MNNISWLFFVIKLKYCLVKTFLCLKTWYCIMFSSLFYKGKHSHNVLFILFLLLEKMMRGWACPSSSTTSDEQPGRIFFSSSTGTEKLVFLLSIRWHVLIVFPLMWTSLFLVSSGTRSTWHSLVHYCAAKPVGGLYLFSHHKEGR